LQQDSASNGSSASNHSPLPDATTTTAAAASTAAAAAAAGAQPSSNFAKRVVFGLILGLGGAAVVAAGGVPYLLVALLVVYQATQEYFGFITSKGISQGMTPPPVFVSIMTTALCLSITLFTFVSRWGALHPGQTAYAWLPAAATQQANQRMHGCQRCRCSW